MGTIRFAALALFAICAVAVAVSQVFAHAEYDYSQPNDGDVLQVAPSRVDAYFQQDMFRQPGANGLNVLDPHGNDVDNNDAIVDEGNRRHMSITLQGGLTSGEYTVEWNTTSDEDGDTDDGTFQFTLELGEPTAQPSSTPSAGTTPVATAVAVAAAVPNTGGGPTTGGDGGVPAGALGLAVVGVTAIAAGGLFLRRREG